MTTGQDARLFDLGYRSYDGPRERPARAVATLAEFTARRVLGVGRGARHKVLPAITLAIAFLPALASVIFSVLADDILARRPHQLRRLHVHHRERARALRRARRARGALSGPAQRDARPLPLRPARPDALPRGQGRGRLRRHAPDHRRPAALHAARLRARGLRAVGRRDARAAAAHPRGRDHDRASVRGAVDGGLELHDPASRGSGRRHPAPLRAGERRACGDRERRRAERARPAQLALRRGRARLSHLRRDARRLRTGHGALDLARGRRRRRRRSWPARSSAGSATGGWRRSDDERATGRRGERLEVVRRARRRLRRQLRRRPWRDGAPRPERRRQVDDVPHALRPRPAVQGHGPRARP